MNNSSIPPRLLQWIGIGMLVGFAVFWIVTGRESELLVGAAGSLILMGRYEDARTILRLTTKPREFNKEKSIVPLDRE